MDISAVIAIIFVMVLITAILIFIIIMSALLKGRRRSKCPIEVYLRCELWYKSYILWTIIDYSCLVLQIVFSLLTIYFTINRDHMQDLSVVVFALLSAFATIVKYMLLPDRLARGFIQAWRLLDYKIMQHESSLVTLEEVVCAIKKGEDILDNII